MMGNLASIVAVSPSVRLSARQFQQFETMYGPSEGFVYFVGNGAPDWVKVGFTRAHPFVRLKALQAGSPVPLSLLGFTFGTMAMEAEIHDVLGDNRAEGEWFHWDPYVARIVEDVVDGGVSYQARKR